MSGQLVEQWPVIPLGELCQIKTGRKDANQGSPNGKYPFFTCAKEHIWSEEYSFEGEALLIAGNGDVGNTTYYDGKFEAYQRTYVLMDFKGVSANFLFYALGDRLKAALVDKKLGSTMPYIKKGMLSNFPITVPPMREQQRIVSILDEAFESITESLDQLKLNLINANEQFSSVLQSIFTVEDDEWNESPLIEVVEETCTLSYGIVQPGSETVGGIPVVRPTDLSQVFIFADGLKRIDPLRADSYSRTELVGGEILLCVRGSTGKISIADEELKGANVTRGIVPIRFDLTKISQKFGYYLLLSEYLQFQIREKTYGSTLQQINIRDVKQLMVRYPSLDRQTTILLKLENLFTQTKNLISNYESKYENIISLKQSILQEAFNGTL